MGHSGPSSNPSVFFTFERQRHTGDLLHDVSLNQSVVIAFGYGGEILGINPPNFTEIVNGSISEPLQFPDAKACPVLSSTYIDGPCFYTYCAFIKKPVVIYDIKQIFIYIYIYIYI